MSEPTIPPPPPPYYTPPPPAGPGSGAVSPNRQIMIVLSYLWLLALVPFITEKEDREVQWHARHGLVLMIAEFAVWIAFWFVNIMLAFMHLSILGCFLYVALSLGVLILHIMCIVKGVNGQRMIIPVISQYADKF
jgi:uncharacterized membrane protein